MAQTVGMIGIGLMGHGIAYNLAKSGYQLTVLEHAGNQPLTELTAMGVKTGTTIADVVIEADFVILCVTGAPQVEEIITGTNGVAAYLPQGCIVIDCSTSLPETSLRVATQIAAVGGYFLDAAMTRLPVHARAGTLNLLVGGDAAILQKGQALLACFSENITHVGPTGSGHLMKLLHNTVSIGMVALLGEVAAHAAKAGLSAEVLIDVLTKGGGGGAALQRISPYLLTGDAQNMAFTISNAAKDLHYYTRAADAAGVAHAIAESIAQTLQKVTQQGDGKAYLPELTSILQNNEQL